MFSQIKNLILKDLRLDLRSMENFISMFFFSFIILLIFAFALPAEEVRPDILAPGIFWVTFLLSGILSLNKAFQIEKENHCMDALLLSPVSRGSIFLGKMAGNVIFIMVIQLLLVPLFGLLFDPRFFTHFAGVLGLGLVAALGFASLGTLLGGLTTDLRFKEILLPILLFPLLVPLLLASVKIMNALLAGNGLLAEADWLKMLLGFDAIFLIVSFLTFDFVMEI